MPADRPNIVLITTDQQSFKMMGCAGNPHVRTPAMDSLAAGGVRFDRAYCTNPVCVPSRFSLFTGRYPSEIGQRANPSRHLPPIPDRMVKGSLGRLLREAGYETMYGGKVHLPKGLTPERIGFGVLTADERHGLAEAAARYVRADHERPFCLVASFINPHDICYMGIRDFGESDFDRLLLEKGEVELAALDWALERPPGVSEAEFFADNAPPLPANFAPQEDEPEAIVELLRERPFRWRERTEWPDERWREHRWAYARLTQRVDAQIGTLLEAVRERGPDGDTVIIFTSDHGDHDSSHKLEHKTVPYDEAARIPLIVCHPGRSLADHEDTAHLVSNGLDLLPTVCDYARAEVPSDLLGRSLRPLVEGREAPDWRDHLLVESQVGDALVTADHKYVLCGAGENREQLYDLRRDPHETRNWAREPGLQDVLGKHRRLHRASTERQRSRDPLA
jgi:choline-sulfatase